MIAAEFAADSPDLQRILLLDTMASRYNLLPSEILRRGDTLDVLVLDTAMSWHAEQQRQAQSRDGSQTAPHIPVNKLKDMIAKVRNNEDRKDQ